MKESTLKSRKMVSFIILILGVNGLVYVMSLVHTPDNVAMQALWVLGVAGCFTIGGQSLVDSVVKFAETRSHVPVSGPSVVTTTEVKT